MKKQLFFVIAFSAFQHIESAESAVVAFRNTVARFHNGLNLATVIEKSGKAFSTEELFRIQAALLAVHYGKYSPGYGFAHHSHSALLTDKDLGMPYQNFMEMFPLAVLPQVVPLLPSDTDLVMYKILKGHYKSEDHEKMKSAIGLILSRYTELAKQQHTASNNSLSKTENRIRFIDALAQKSPHQLLRKAELNGKDHDLSVFHSNRQYGNSICFKHADILTRNILVDLCLPLVK